MIGFVVYYLLEEIYVKVFERLLVCIIRFIGLWRCHTCYTTDYTHYLEEKLKDLRDTTGRCCETCKHDWIDIIDYPYRVCKEDDKCSLWEKKEEL